MQDELFVEEELDYEESLPPSGEESIGRFCRRMFIKMALVWGVLLLFCFECYLVEEKQILAHPVESFIQQVDLNVYYLRVGVTAELPSAANFAELKPVVIRAGRLLGISPEDGTMDARITDEGRVLNWTASDRRGRQHTISGRIKNGGSVTLDIETACWGSEARVKDISRELHLLASRFGRVTGTRLEVEGTALCQKGAGPENWVQQWRLRDLEVSRRGSAVNLRGATSDLTPGRRQEVSFTLSFLPLGEDRGRLILSVGS